VVVPDNDDEPGLAPQLVDAAERLVQLIVGVEVVVLLVAARILAEPGAPVPAVEPQVAELARDKRPFPKGIARQRHVEAGDVEPQAGDEIEGVLPAPRGVPHLENPRKVCEIAGDPLEETAAPIRVTKEKRELEEEAGEPLPLFQDPEAFPEHLDVLFRVRPPLLVGEARPELDHEPEAIVVRHLVEPLLGRLGCEGAVEGAVDLHAVEIAGEVAEFLLLPARVDHVLPVGIAPSGGADEDRCFGHGFFLGNFYTA